MTLTALEKSLIKFTEALEKWETAGLRGCDAMHDCRAVAGVFTIHVSCVKRAVGLIKEGKVEEALHELGDYVVCS